MSKLNSVVRLNRAAAYALELMANKSNLTVPQVIERLAQNYYHSMSTPWPTPPEPSKERSIEPQRILPLRTYLVTFYGKPKHYTQAAHFVRQEIKVEASSPLKARQRATAGFYLRPGLMIPEGNRPAARWWVDELPIVGLTDAPRTDEHAEH